MMAILVLVYEFGCRRWDFNWRYHLLYDTIEGAESIKAFVTEKTGVIKDIKPSRIELVDTQFENNMIKI